MNVKAAGRQRQVSVATCAGLHLLTRSATKEVFHGGNRRPAREIEEGPENPMEESHFMIVALRSCSCDGEETLATSTFANLSDLRGLELAERVLKKLEPTSRPERSSPEE